MTSDNPHAQFDLGPLEQLLPDPDITEIMVNGTSNIYIEKQGRLIETDLHFEDEADILNTIESIFTSLGRSISDKAPIMDARLADGSRVNAVLRPIAITGPTLTIRKFAKAPLTIQQLIDYGSWTQKIVDFLEAAVAANINLIVSGGTNSGKTTVFNILSGFIRKEERIVTVETVAELQLQHKHIVSLEARPADPQGEGEITVQQLIMNSTRMRPDRIIAGEIQGAEAWDMLHVMTSGYDGSMFTLHATNANDALDRIELWCSAAANVPILQVRGKIAQGINLIVQQNRLHDGSRKITQIAEVTGIKNNLIETRDIVRYVETSATDGQSEGIARFTGYRPTFADKLNLPATFFVE